MTKAQASCSSDRLGSDRGEHLVTHRAGLAAAEHLLDVGGEVACVHDRQGVRLVGRVVMAQCELVATPERGVPWAEPQGDPASSTRGTLAELVALLRFRGDRK